MSDTKIIHATIDEIVEAVMIRLVNRYEKKGKKFKDDNNIPMLFLSTKTFTSEIRTALEGLGREAPTPTEKGGSNEA